MKNRMIVFSLALVLLGTVFLLAGCSESDPAILMHKAAAADKAGQSAAALKYSEKAAKIAPENFEIRLMYALMLEKSGRLSDAATAAKDALALAPNDFSALFTLGRIQGQIPEDRVDALANLLRAQRMDGANLDVSRILASLYAHAGNYQKMFLYLNRLSDDKQSPAHQNLMGIYYYSITNYDRAYRHFVNAYARARTAPEVLYNLGSCQEKLNKKSAAAKTYREFLANSSGNPDYAAMRAQVEERLVKLQ